MNNEYVARLLEQLGQAIEHTQRVDPNVEELKAEAYKYSELVAAMDKYDARWADPKVCFAKARQLYLEASALLDGVEHVMAQMETIENAAISAAMIRTRGDEQAAYALLKDYGGKFNALLMQRMDSFDGLEAIPLDAEPTALNPAG